MKKLFITLILLLVPFAFVGCLKEEVQLSSYKIDAVYDEDSQSLTCTSLVTYVNNTDNALENVCFFTYANAFDQGQKPVATSNIHKAYPNGESYGNIKFSKVEVEGQEQAFVQDQNNYFNVDLQKTLFPQESVQIYLEYTVQLANINHRLGYGENAVNFGNVFPIACVYENGSFVKNDFSVNGDPFYSETANFEVNLTCNKDFVVACTGNKTELLQADQKVVSCKAEKVRDFCFVLSKNFEVIENCIDNVVIKYFYYDDDNAKNHLQTAVNAFSTFKKLFGDYPYKQLSVVKTNFCYGGMEYPNLVMIADSLPDSETFDYVIVHEIAHQWWYSLVGNNEFSEGWLDESITEYSTFLFYENNPSYQLDYQTLIENATLSYKKFVQVYTDILGEVDQSMNRKLNDFNTEPEYVNCVYTKGVLLYDSLRTLIGEQKFFKSLNCYFNEYKYKNATTQNLIDTFSKTAKINLTSFFESWLEGKVIIN